MISQSPMFAALLRGCQQTFSDAYTVTHSLIYLQGMTCWCSRCSGRSIVCKGRTCYAAWVARRLEDGRLSMAGWSADPLGGGPTPEPNHQLKEGTIKMFIQSNVFYSNRKRSLYLFLMPKSLVCIRNYRPKAQLLIGLQGSVDKTLKAFDII